MRTSSANEMNKQLQNPKTNPIMGGLIADPIPGRIRKLEERVSNLEKLAHINPSGCCCKFDEDGEALVIPWHW